MAKSSIALPGKEELAAHINEVFREPTLAERLHAEQVADKQLIIEIQQRMADRRGKIAFVEDTPNAELMVKALARFYSA